MLLEVSIRNTSLKFFLEREIEMEVTTRISKIAKPFKRQRGITLLEYAIIAALIAAISIVIIQAIGEKVNGVFTNINEKLPTQ